MFMVLPQMSVSIVNNSVSVNIPTSSKIYSTSFISISCTNSLNSSATKDGLPGITSYFPF